MFRIVSAITVSALIALCTSLAAQEATDAADDSPSRTGTADSGGSGPVLQPDLGQPVDEEGRVLGERYMKETYGDWQLLCYASREEQDPCELHQVLLDDNDQPTAAMTMFRLAQGPAVMVANFVVPLETFLPGQLTFSIGDHLGKRYAFRFCAQIGCVVQAGLLQDDIDLMLESDGAMITIYAVAAPEERINVPVSLQGFAKGYSIVDIVDIAEN